MGRIQTPLLCSKGRQLAIRWPGHDLLKCSNAYGSLSDSDGVGGVCRLRPHRASPAGNRLQFGTHLQLAAHIPQDVHELTPELHSHEGVQDGIEAAVEIAQGGGDHHGFFQKSSDSTAVVRIKCVHHESDVVRRPADEEYHHHGHDDPESFLLLKALGAAAQPVQDAGITEDEDDGGQQEARRVGQHAGGQFPIKDSIGVEPEVVWNTLCSVVSPGILNSMGKDPVREGEQQREDPHRQAADVNHPGVPAGVHLGRVDDGQVAVQTDARQQEDPTVEVDLGVKINHRRVRNLFAATLAESETGLLTGWLTRTRNVT